MYIIAFMYNWSNWRSSNVQVAQHCAAAVALALTKAAWPWIGDWRERKCIWLEQRSMWRPRARTHGERQRESSFIRNIAPFPLSGEIKRHTHMMMTFIREWVTHGAINLQGGKLVEKQNYTHCLTICRRESDCHTCVVIFQAICSTVRSFSFSPSALTSPFPINFLATFRDTKWLFPRLPSPPPIWTETIKILHFSSSYWPEAAKTRGAALARVQRVSLYSAAPTLLLDFEKTPLS